MTNLMATVVSGLSSYDSSSWSTAAGTQIALPDTFVAAGNTATFVGSLGSLGNDEWLRLSFGTGGVGGVFGYTITPVPEPGTWVLSLLGLGLIALTRGRMNRLQGCEPR